MKAEKTKEIIALSLSELLSRCPFDDITVDMICKEAGIGRSTFYRLYKDKYEVLVNFFIIKYQSIEAAYPDAKDYQKMMTEYLSLLKKYGSFFKKAFSVSGQNSLSEYIYQAGYDYYISHIEKQDGHKIAEDMAMTVILFDSGILTLVTKWIEQDFPAEPERLAGIIASSMPDNMVRYFR